MNSTRHVRQRAVDDDDVWHVGFAHVDRVETGRGLDDDEFGPPRMRLATLRMTLESSTNMQRFISDPSFLMPDRRQCPRPVRSLARVA